MNKDNLISRLNENQEQYEKMAKDIWNRPELALAEDYASSRQKDYLRSKGFVINEIRGLPTAFVAEYGRGKPVIAFLGEYDALPDMSQKVQTIKEAEVGCTAGHACGHNLIGTGGLAAAEAVGELIRENGLDGTVRYYGCPAEERYSGKILMQKEGVFNDIDISLIWHPQDISGISRKQYYSSLAMMRVDFYGETGHSMAAKKYGGSALHAINLMVSGIQNMREYMWDFNRLHYYISDAGKTANLLPEKASIYCEFRAKDKDVLSKICERLKEIAEGAAKMSGTNYSWEIEDEMYSDLENQIILDRIEENMKSLEKILYTDEEIKFVTELAKTLPSGAEEKVRNFYCIPEEDVKSNMHIGIISAEDLIYLPSDDAGNISHEVPFGTFLISLAPIGMPMHCWQVTALAGSSIGTKCMMRAAKIMACTAYDFLTNSDLTAGARKNFDIQKKAGCFHNSSY